MQINLVYGSSVQSAPAGFTAAVAFAAAQLGGLISNPITVNIRVGYGENAGINLAGTDLANGGPANGEYMSYSQLRAELTAQATSAADASVLANLPATDPTNGGRFYISGAQRKAWGLISPVDGAIDGSVGFSSAFANFNFNLDNRAIAGQYDFVGIAEHELTHALDRFAGSSPLGVYDPLNLFRYTAAGALQVDPSKPAFFSTDGGATRLYPFDTSSDYGDWGPTGTNDAFAAFSSLGVMLPISATDITVLDVLGYAMAGTPTLPMLTAAPHYADFNGDHTSDILFQNSNGALAVWTCQGGVATAAFSLGGLAAGWTVAGTGHFFGPGTSDILLANSNGTIAEWRMQGGQAVSATLVGNTDLSHWRVAGTGDFFGDGTSDILFRDTASGTIAEWRVQAGQAVSATTVGTTTPDWTIVGIGNLRGTGATDSIMFINSNGLVADWDVVNGQATEAHVIGQTSAYWSVSGLGDFNGDRQNDILFRGQDGQIAIWQMQNGTVTGSATVGLTTADWQIAGIGDYNGDGTADILFRNTQTNGVAAWEMSAGQVTRVAYVGTTSAGWTVASG